MKRLQTRNSKGSVLPMAISLMLVISVIGTGVCQLLLAMGANVEVQNAVNAGALRVGQRVLAVTENTKEHDVADSDFDQFHDVAWKNNGKSHFTVGNINRAMAKAMLINANAADMRESKMSTSQSDWNAKHVADAAQRISSSIKKALQDRHYVEEDFSDFTQSNSTRMGTLQTKVEPHQARWETAYVDEGRESNVYINKNVLPVSQQDAFPTVSKDGKNYITGYRNSKLTNLRMVPFRQGERPALISATNFNAKQKPTVETDLPNAFACHGKATSRQGHDIHATAMVQTHPQQEFDMRLTDGWIRIVLHRNDVDFLMYGLPIKTDHYGHRPGYSPSVGFPVYIGWGKVTAYCGNEYVPPTVWSCLFPPLCTGDSEAQSRLVQRLRELRPDLNDDQLKAPLKSATVSLTTSNDQVFYVFLDKSNNIVVRPEGSSDIPLAARNGAKPDGQGRGYDQKYILSPNQSTAKIYGIPKTKIITFCRLEGGVNWIPGTGYNGCLGQIEHKDRTLCYIICVPKGTAAPVPPGGSMTETAESATIPVNDEAFANVTAGGK